MWPLISSELTRFRTLALTLAAVHLLVLRFVAGSGPFFTPTFGKTALALVAYAVLGLALGLYQFGSLKRPGQWTFLLHRPLAPGRIFAAVTSAGLLLLTVTVALPLGALTAYLGLFSPQAVDARQALLAPFALGLAASFYLLGAWATLARTRAALLAGGLVVFFLTRQAPGWSVFVPLGLVLVVFGLLAWGAFKPDLGSPLRRPAAVLAAALALGYSAFWLLSYGGLMVYPLSIIFREHGITGLSTFAWNDYFPPGTSEFVAYRDSRAALAHGLVGNSERERHLASELPLAKVLDGPDLAERPFATRHQLMIADVGLELVDVERGVRWTFQHDEMCFQGIEERTQRAVGWLGLAGLIVAEPRATTPWPQVPLVVGERYLALPQEFYEVDFARQAVDLRFALPAGESFRAPLTAGDTFFLMASDRTLYFFEPRLLQRPAVRWVPFAAVALPAPGEQIRRVLATELVDGFLVSWVIENGDELERWPERQVVQEVHFDGTAETVAERPLVHGFPALYRYRGFWVSPLTQLGHDLLWSAIAPRRPNRIGLAEVIPAGAPPEVFGWAALVAGLSALASGGLARFRGLPRRQVWGWAAAGLLLGAPGLCVTWWLTERDEALGLPAARTQSPTLACTAEGGVA